MRTPIVGFTEGEVTNLCVKYGSDFSMMKYFYGLSGTVAEPVGGGEVKMDPRGFANDLVTFRNRDDVLTLLIHLGYLAYDEDE